MRNRLAALLLVLVAAVPARCDRDRRPASQRAADHLRSRLADRRVSDVRRGPELQLRGLERARDADPERRAGRRLRVGCAPQHATPLPCRPRREAGHLHGQPPRVDRATSKSGRNQDDLRPALEAREARRCGACGAGRRLHDHRPPQDGALERPRQGRQPRVGCASGYGKDRARSGRRRLRLRDGCARGQRSGDGDPDPCVGPASRAVRDRRRRRARRTGLPRGRSSTRSSRPGARPRSGTRASCRCRRQPAERIALPGHPLPGDGRGPRLPRAAGDRDLRARAAGRARRVARNRGGEGRARRHGQDQRDLDGPHPRLRHAGGLLDRDALVAPP